MTHYDLIVVGGGVSGLTLANRAAYRGQLSILVLEKETRLGGCVHTWQAQPDYWLELGAHTAYNSYKNLLQILQERHGLEEIIPRRRLGYRFLDGGRLQSALGRIDWLELFGRLPFGLLRSKQGLSLADYYSALFGPRNYARMLAPAFAAVLSQPADAFPAQWLFRRKSRMREVPRRYAWDGGLQRMIEALVANAPFEVATGMPVTAIRRQRDGFEVMAGGEMLVCRHLALATPPDAAARLLLDSLPHVAARLSRIPMAEIESLAVVVPAARVRLPELAGIIGVEDDFYSVVSRDPLPHPRLRGFTFHFRPQRLDSAAKLARVCAVLGIAPDDILGVHETVNRLPALTVEHVDQVAELDETLRDSTLYLTGNYFQGLSLGDCADRSTREAYRLLKTHHRHHRKEAHHG
ncbi:MAG: FAD-dependent oxidoreductase [Thiobacillaceae bacterium]|nr:FAD-dependent oxidoreductase [Thiobacillaceae bacterium]MCX7673814.1 FAD-dependent oxidoreductase [Thiobacillaceae bacterium]MDW8323572.1 FAD-dependent oxidoreductase [Burkholderiales bacterium]